MTANELWNLLSCHGNNETVEIDATGLKIGPRGHILVPLAPDLVDALASARYSDLLASEGLRVDL
jgi:hypothetical protein